MPVFAANINYQGKQANFARDQFSTLADMKACPDSSIDEGHISFCVETGKHYEFKSSNSVDATMGRWREWASGTGALSVDDTKTIEQAVTASAADKSKLFLPTDKTDIVYGGKVLNGETIRNISISLNKGNGVYFSYYFYEGNQLVSRYNKIPHFGSLSQLPELQYLFMGIGKPLNITNENLLAYTYFLCSYLVEGEGEMYSYYNLRFPVAIFDGSEQHTSMETIRMRDGMLAGDTALLLQAFFEGLLNKGRFQSIGNIETSYSQVHSNRFTELVKRIPEFHILTEGTLDLNIIPSEGTSIYFNDTPTSNEFLGLPEGVNADTVLTVKMEYHADCFQIQEVQTYDKLFRRWARYGGNLDYSFTQWVEITNALS